MDFVVSARVRTVDTTSLNYSPLAISRSIDPLNRRIAADFFWDKRYAQGSVRGYPSEEKLMYELLVGDSSLVGGLSLSFPFYNLRFIL